MDAKRFKHLWSKPAEARDEDLSELRNVCLNNPFFAAGQMLYAKVLHDRADYQFNKQLKWAALFCPNRELLHDYIHDAAKIAEKPSLDFDPQKSDNAIEVTTDKAEGVTPITKKEEIENPVVSEKTVENIFTAKEETAAESTTSEEVTPIATTIIEKPKPEVELKKENKTEVNPKNKEKITIAKETSVSTPSKSSGGNEDWAERIAALRKKSEEVIGKISQNLEDKKTNKKEVIAEEIIAKENPIEDNFDDSNQNAEKEPIVPEDNPVQTEHDDQNQASVQDEKPSSDLTEINEEKEDEVKVDFVLDLTDIQKEDVSLSEEHNYQQELPQAKVIDSSAEKYSPQKTDAVEEEKELEETASQSAPSSDFFSWLRTHSSSEKTKTTDDVKPEQAVSRVFEEKREEEIQSLGNEKIKENRKKIDAFLDKLPKIAGPKKAKHDDFKLSPVAFSTGIEEDSDLVTETLARIYIEQGHVDKAIKAYEILMLKMPEKSSLFARQIQSLKNQNKK